MAVIVNGDGILTGISSLATALTDLTSGRGTVTGVATVGTLQLGAGVSMGSPRSQNAAIFTNGLKLDRSKSLFYFGLWENLTARLAQMMSTFPKNLLVAGDIRRLKMWIDYKEAFLPDILVICHYRWRIQANPSYHGKYMPHYK